MSDDSQKWSYENDIPDGTSWEELFFDLKWFSKRLIIQSGYRFQMIEFMLQQFPEDKDNMLKLATEGNELLKLFWIYNQKIDEFILRLRDRDNAAPDE